MEKTEITAGTRVRVSGPVAADVKNAKGDVVGTTPDSAQLGKVGVVLSSDGDVVTVSLEGETRPRNFRAEHLAKA